MLSKDFLLGLLAVPFASCIVDASATDRHAKTRDIKPQNQAVLGSVRAVDAPPPTYVYSGGRKRSYRLSIPSDHDPSSSKKLPLIVDFHGHGGDAEGQWDNSQYYLNPTASKEFFVAYPNGCVGHGTRGEKAWQGAPYADASCNDILFVSDLIQDVSKNYSIDQTRIYASGKSNGGGFVGTLACSLTGDLFAAFAMASAALYTDTIIHPDACPGKAPKLILESHGMIDPIIPIYGTIAGYNPITGEKAQGDLPNIYTWAQRWATRNGCDPNKNAVYTPADWGVNFTYSCGATTNVVQQYSVNGLGHCWPSTTTNTDIAKSSDADPCQIVDLDFTSAVIDFFSK